VSESEFLREEWKQRAYDGKWMRLVQVKDHDSAYTYKKGESTETITPRMWVIAGVYDYLITMEA